MCFDFFWGARPPAPVWILWIVLWCAACGDPLVTGTYRGEPLVELEGRLLIRSAASTPETLNVALFWMSPSSFVKQGEGSLQPLDLAEQPVLSRGLTLTRYQLKLYRPPPQEAIQRHEGGARLGLGLLLLYDDADRDGRWGESRELLVGGAGQYVLLYAPDGLEEGVVGEPLEPGYHLMRLAPYYERCLQGSTLASMRKVEGRREVNLMVRGELGGLLPDLDCDGVVGDWCERVLIEAQTQALGDAEEERQVYDEFVECLEVSGLGSPCLEFLSPATLLSDEAPAPEATAQYEACLADQAPDQPVGPQQECDFFLQELQWATSQEQADELARAYEECVRQYEIEPAPPAFCVDDPALGACVEVTYYCERLNVLASWLPDPQGQELVYQLTQACLGSEAPQLSACVLPLAFAEYAQDEVGARRIAQEFLACLVGVGSGCTQNLAQGFAEVDGSRRVEAWENYGVCRASLPQQGYGDLCWESLVGGLLGGGDPASVEAWLWLYEGCTGQPLDDCEVRLRGLPEVDTSQWGGVVEGVAQCLARM